MIDFPASPTDGQVFSAPNGVVYQYSTTYTSWLAQNAAPQIGGTGDFYASTTNVSQVASGTAAIVQIGTVVTGNSGSYYSPTTWRWTPPAGRYLFYGWCCVQSGGAGASTQILQLTKNGVAIPNTSGQAYAAAGNAPTTISLNTVVDANGTDVFDMRTQSAGNNGTVIGAGIGAFPLTGMQGPMGPIGQTQTVSVETGAVATGTTVIPYDDTIPQITEGDQYMTLAITPKSATSKLIIDVVWNGSSGVAGNTMLVALFQDSTANALAMSAAYFPAATVLVNVKFTHIMTSGTTSATTFRVRAGTTAAGTTTFNGDTGARRFGGAMASSIVISEVAP